MFDFKGSDFYLESADSCLEQKKYEEAITFYNKVLQIVENHEEALFKKGICLFHLYHDEEAIKCFDAALKITPGDAEVWAYKGYVLERNSEKRLATACYEKAVQLDPKHYGAWIHLGYLYGEEGANQKAIECFDHALLEHPRDDFSRLEKGRLLAKEGQYDDALNCIDKVLNDAPHWILAMQEKAEVLEKMDRHEEAKVFFDKAGFAISSFTNKTDQDDKKILSDFVDDLVKRFDKFESDSETNVDTLLDSLDMTVYYEDWENMSRISSRIITLDPNNSEAWFRKGQALYNKNYADEEAIKHYDKVIEISKDFVQLAHWGKSLTYDAQKNLQKALECCDQALSMPPEDPRLWDLRGIISLKMGNEDEADRCFARRDKLEK